MRKRLGCVGVTARYGGDDVETPFPRVRSSDYDYWAVEPHHFGLKLADDRRGELVAAGLGDPQVKLGVENGEAAEIASAEVVVGFADDRGQQGGLFIGVVVGG
jgi:hypothetical protein